MLWATSPPLLISTVTLRISRAALPVALLWIPKLILDGIVAVGRGSGEIRRIWLLVGLELLVALLDEILSRVNNAVDSLLGDRFTNYVGIRLMDHAGLLDLSTFEDPVFYDQLERVRSGSNGRMSLLASLLSMAQECGTLTILVTGLFMFSPWLVLLVAVSTIPSFVGEANYARLAYSVFFRRSPQRRELEYLRFLGTCVESAKEVRIFGLGPYLSAKYRSTADRIFIENKAITLRRVRSAAALGLLASLGYYVGYAVALARVLRGAISIGTFSFVVGSFTRSRTSAERVLASFSDISEEAVSLSDLLDFFKTAPSIRSVPNAIRLTQPIQKGFEFRNVSFAYPGSERLVIRNVSLRIGASERVALIGENGAGKTTIVKLLARLYDPVCGQILLDGVDLREYDLSDLRQKISVIFQDFMRYDLAVRENIGFGDLTSLNDDLRLTTASHKSGAQRVIDRFSLGFDQLLGRRFEGGADLSGGEWQKIALARAHIRDAELLILDEPTASLDARAEHEVFTRFSDLAAGRMAVLISHRLSTARLADKIVVLECGEIREQGTHEQLVQLKGHYAELFELQAAGFREGFGLASQVDEVSASRV
jgi:ATP-binding cassette subfamily B protein